MGNHDYISLGFIYGLIMNRGPLSMHGIAEILRDEYGISDREFRLSVHCSVGGILSAMSRSKIIQCLPHKEFSYYKLWTLPCKNRGNISVF